MNFFSWLRYKLAREVIRGDLLFTKYQLDDIAKRAKKQNLPEVVITEELYRKSYQLRKMAFALFTESLTKKPYEVSFEWNGVIMNRGK